MTPTPAASTASKSVVCPRIVAEQIIDIIDATPSREGEIRLEEADAMYCTISRGILRLQRWIQYMENGSNTTVPDVTEFLFSLDPAGYNNALVHCIWGADEDSLISHQGGLEALQRDLKPLQLDLEALQRDLTDLQSEIQNLTVTRDTVFAGLQGQSKHIIQLLRDQQQDLIKKQEDLIKSKEETIKKQGDLIKKQGDLIKEREENITHIKSNTKEKLEKILVLHRDVRNVLYVLAGKGNQTAVTASCSARPDEDRVYTSGPEPLLAAIEEIDMIGADETFLQQLLTNDKIERHRKDLLELQTFVAAILRRADRKVISKEKNKKWEKDLQPKVSKFVDAILKWKPGLDVESLEKTGFACPSKGCETIADQPILFALISRILAIIGQSSLSVRSEQVLGPVKYSGRGRRIDFIVDEPRENLHVLYPEMLGRAIEVKPASHDDATGFNKNQGKAREQVLGHLAKRLLASFDFGGIGQDDVVCGVVLSMISVQVIEMQLRDVGTEAVAIVVRQTPLVPLLGETLVPHEIHQNSEDWNLESNGVFLLASAMLELPRQSLFGNDTELTMKDCSANDEQITIGALLGSGSFAHVVQLEERMFMKIPRSKRLVMSLEKECKVLQKLQRNPFIPEIMPWGISTVAVSVRGEISKMKVLRLNGLVGSSLSCFCKSNFLEMEVGQNSLDAVIEQVGNALEYAHQKGIVHLDVRPSNIIVTQVTQNFADVLLADWGCSMMFKEETIKNGTFVGCAPYAHDSLLGARKGVLVPNPEFDLASLGYTWYHVVQKGIPWQFDRPKLVSDNQLNDRRKLMVDFLKKRCVAVWAQKIYGVFVELDEPAGSGRKRGSSFKTFSWGANRKR